jgi:general secretion pathway protein H
MRRHSQGFSLMELMAVLMVVGLGLGIVTLAVGHGGPEKQIYTKLEQFMVQADFASEHAVITGEAIGLLLEPPDWQITEDADVEPEDVGWRYRWQKLGPKGWENIDNMPAVSFSPSVEIEVRFGTKRWDWRAKTTDKKSPVLSISPSGEITQFEIQIRDKNLRDFSQHIELSEDGEIVWREAVEDEKKREDL